MREEVTLTKDCKAVQIPYGYDVPLAEGAKVTIVQALGGSYTVLTDQGMMVRVAGPEVEALGKSASVAPQIEGEVTKEKLEELVWDQLRTTYDPEIPVNIVELGLVYLCELDPVEDGGFKAKIKMTLTAPGCGMGPVLAEDVRGKVMALPGVKDADVQVVFDPVWDRNMMSEAAKLQLGIW
jgi:probable FeS assembly SUF system protein SufT